MKRVFVVFREFSENGTDFRPVYGIEVFTTYKRAKESVNFHVGKTSPIEVVETTQKPGEIPFLLKTICKTNMETWFRYTIVEKVLNINY